MKYALFSLLFLGWLGARAQIDTVSLLHDLRELSSDKYEGRQTGTKGSILARNYIISRYHQIGLIPYTPTYKMPFSVVTGEKKQKGTDSVIYEKVQGANIIGYIKGQTDSIIAITAHFDHIGIIDGQIYNGADDNASGVCAMFAIAQHFIKDPPRHTLVFIAFDAEEMYMRGSLALTYGSYDFKKTRLNINLDMIATNTDRKLLLAGTRYNPWLRDLLKPAMRKSPGVFVAFGYDNPNAYDDRTFRSDHAIFHESGVPFLYFGVPEHKNYHQPGDDYEYIDQKFYTRVVDFILSCVIELDKSIPGNQEVNHVTQKR